MQVWSGLNPDPQFENLEKGFMYIFMLCTKSLYFSGHSEEMGRMQWREPDRSEKCRVDQWGWLVWFVPSFDNKKYKKITRFCIPVFEDGNL